MILVQDMGSGPQARLDLDKISSRYCHQKTSLGFESPNLNKIRIEMFAKKDEASNPITVSLIKTSYFYFGWKLNKYFTYW